MEQLPVYANNSGVVDEGQLLQVEQWRRGMQLRTIVGTEAWEILLDTLHSYVEKADDDLRSLPPGHPDVVTAHAALSALHQGFKLFQEDVNAAVNAAQTVPDALRNTVQGL